MQTVIDQAVRHIADQKLEIEALRAEIEDKMALKQRIISRLMMQSAIQNRIVKSFIQCLIEAIESHERINKEQKQQHKEDIKQQAEMNQQQRANIQQLQALLDEARLDYKRTAEFLREAKSFGEEHKERADKL